jgi:dihydroneopterin aldolase
MKAKITVHKPNAPIVYEFNDVSVTVKGKRERQDNSKTGAQK